MPNKILAPEIPYTQAELQQLFDYDRETGEFTWRIPPWDKPDLKGKQAWVMNRYGTAVTNLSRKQYYATDLIWLRETGTPPNGVMVLDGNRLNLKFDNLGEVLINLPKDFVLDQEWANKLFSYDPETGIVTRKLLTSYSVIVGEAVGTATGRGYLHVRIGRKSVPVHRLIFLMMTGHWPDRIDHINSRIADNRWVNLRSVTASGNCRNRALQKRSISGFCGVTKVRRSGRWKAYIYIGGKKKHLGVFSDKADAIAAREAANIKYGFHPNHGRTQQEREKYETRG